MEHILEYRIIESKDWATLLFVFAFVLIAITKTYFEVRFSDFLKLIINDKYLKIYKDSTHLMSWFTISLFVVQLISLAFFIQILFSYFGFTEKTNLITYIQILTGLIVFVLSKYLIEKIVATCFKIEDFVEQFNLQKVSYRTFIGLFLLPINVILFYNVTPPHFIIIALVFTVLIINVLTYFVSLRLYQNLLFSKLFYFILYLCALEIAPYYFMYYLFTRS